MELGCESILFNGGIVMYGGYNGSEEENTN